MVQITRKVDRNDRLTRDGTLAVCDYCWARLGTAHHAKCLAIGAGDLASTPASPLTVVADDAEAEWYAAR